MTTARDHLAKSSFYLDKLWGEKGRVTMDIDQVTRIAGVHALLSIACTLADMADMDADTRTQPAIKPPAPAPNYQLYHPGDTERIPT